MYTGCPKSTETSRYFWMDWYINITTPDLHQTYHNIFYGSSEGSPRHVKVVNGVNFNVLYQPLSCDISMERATHQKNSDTWKVFLLHLWPKWWPVTKLTSCLTLTGYLFRTELTYIRVLVNCTMFFLLPCHLKQSATLKRRTITNC